MSKSHPVRKGIVLCLIFYCSALFPQSITISGKVIDSKDLKPIPLVAVFLGNTTIGTTTNVSGEFSLTVSQSGNYDLLFSLLGYSPFSMHVSIKDFNINMGEIKLSVNEISAGQIEVNAERDKNWEHDLSRFKKVFLGENKFAFTTKIVNPWVIEFKDDEKLGLTANAGTPIEIENASLGYRVDYFLKEFWSRASRYAINGNTKFTEMQYSSNEQYLKWKANRMTCYLGSMYHLFRAIVQNRIDGEGFNVYAEREVYTNHDYRSNLFSNELGKSVTNFDTINIVTPLGKGLYRITFPKKLEVHYRFAEVVSRTYQDLDYAVSWLTATKGFVIVNENGFPLNSTDIDAYGKMSLARVACMLPIDYSPQTLTTLEQNQLAYVERTFIHTDKDYYYPGETIWFKGYMRYAIPQNRELLSTTIYVELLNPDLSRVVQSKIFEIKNGAFQGEFTLSDSLVANTYYIRAWTNLQRNYGDQHLFGLPIPILDWSDSVQPSSSSGIEKDSLFLIESDKSSYKPKEKVTLTLTLKDEEGTPLRSNISLSVTDIQQVEPTKIQLTSLDRFKSDFTEKPIFKKDLLFPVEHGISFVGKLKLQSNKPKWLNIFQVKSSIFTQLRTDDHGLFNIQNLSFYDTAAFIVQSIKSKSTKSEACELLVNDKPSLSDFYRTDSQIQIVRNGNARQRKSSNLDASRQYISLSDVEVKGNRIENSRSRPYGPADYVLNTKDLERGVVTGNLLFAIQGRVPGLIVRQVNNPGEETRWVVYISRGDGLSAFNGREVAVTVNDVMMSGNPADILLNINPANVESIEVKKGINVLYGSQGAFGVVSVYLKKDIQDINQNPDHHLDILLVPGYSRSKKFISPDHSEPNNIPDDRSLIYWEPTIFTDAETGKTSISFYAADQPTIYRAVAIGIAQDGRVIKAAYTFSIEP